MDSQQQFADAMRAFDTYYDTRRRLTGADWPRKRYAEHRAWKAFLRVAADCDAAHRDVARYVEVVLTHSPKNGCEIVPNDLNGKRALALWAQHGAKPQVTAKDTWANLVRLLLQIQRGNGQTDEEILLSGFSVQFPSWFRVLYPEAIDARILGKFGEDAVCELKESRETVRFLRAAMPAKMEEFERRMGVVDGLLA